MKFRPRNIPDSGLGMGMGMALLIALVCFACEKDDHGHKHSGTTDDAAKQSRGRDLYERHGCAGCHGKSGRGDGPAASGLPGKPRDLSDRNAYRHGAGVDEINRTLRTGIKGSVMVSFDHLSVVELNLLAGYVVYLQSQP